MKNKRSQSPTATGPSRGKFGVLRQICNLIPPFLVSKIVRETGVDTQARTYSPWSHVVTLLYAQLVHAIGINDVCDSLRLHSGLLVGLRGATPPSRNNLSHANRERDTALAGQLFWAVLEHLRGLHAGFAGGRPGRGLARRFRRVISVVDFVHLWALTGRGIFWVTRAKDNLVFDVIESIPVKGAILRDEIICLGRTGAFVHYPAELRRIVARVEIDGRQTPGRYLP